MTGGDPARGKAAIHNYGCDTCHTIPGIQGADALVGPPLNKIASRSYIGGVIPNTPANMIHWIQNPQDVDHQTAMPNLRVTETDARDISGYLYTLK
jgi:cytochrome c551/c552